MVGFAGLVWIGLALALARWCGRPPLSATLLVAACVWSADLISLGLKASIARPRPFETIAEPDPLLGATVGSSMPSGHATTSLAGAVILAFLVPRAALPLFLLAAAVAYSRIYVGVHYPSDVLAGAGLGAAVSIAFVVGLRGLSGR